MATFDIIVSKEDNFQGYTGNPPSNEAEYNTMKTEMFDGTAPTWTTVKTAMDNYVDPKASAKAKLIAGEALTEEEANTLVI
ncbi:hypothetical protein OAS47_03825 [Pelagibacteraceae bacterium]|nr:hypothetical protein [Pelagibacteraceae bacterium]